MVMSYIVVYSIKEKRNYCVMISRQVLAWLFDMQFTWGWGMWTMALAQSLAVYALRKSVRNHAAS